MATHSSADRGTLTGGSVQLRCTSQPTSEQLKMLKAIAGVVAGDVHVIQVGHQGDIDWVKFHVGGMADNYVLLYLEANQSRLFKGEDRRGWQVLGPSDRRADSGLWLHKLDTFGDSNCRGGVWFY